MTYLADTDIALGRRARLTPTRFTSLARPGAAVAGLGIAAGRGPAPWYDKLWRSVQQADANPGTPKSPGK